jgi:hypothetical protein
MRCWRNPKAKQYEVPGENCFYRVLSAVPIPQLGHAPVDWQTWLYGETHGEIICRDGKTLRGSHGAHLVGALNLQSQRRLDGSAFPIKRKKSGRPKRSLAGWIWKAKSPCRRRFIRRICLNATLVSYSMHRHVRTRQRALFAAS